MTKTIKVSKPAKAAGKGKKITWESKKILVAQIQKTPNNYKIATELGKKRLQQSLKMFGLAGNVIVNPEGKGKYILIDGNSRLEEAIVAKEKFVWASVPNRKLSPEEFKEFSALYDFAKAGEVDMKRIQQDLGTTEEFYKKWNLETPMAVVAKLGKGAQVEEVEYVDETPGASKTKNGKVAAVSDVRMVQIFLTVQQEEEFRSNIEPKLMKKFKVDNTTEVIWSALKSIK